MKDHLEKFYNENPSAFQILGFLFVVTGLIINIPATQGIIGQSLEHLKFFLLVSSGALLLYLISTALVFFLRPYWKNDDGKTTYHIIKKLAISLFFILVASFFLVDLVIYIAYSYPHESLFLLILLLCYIVLVQLSKISLIKNWWSRLWTLLLILFLIAIPIGDYIFLWVNNLNLILWMIAGVFVLALILSIILKKTESKPLLGDKDNPKEDVEAQPQKND